MDTQAIIDRVINNLTQNGAMTPYPTESPVIEDVGLFLRDPGNLKPAAAPLVRFHRAKRGLEKERGSDHSVYQRFFRWQHGFIARGLDIYLPQADFTTWAAITASRIAQAPLPPFYRAIVADHLAKATLSGGALDSFPVSMDEKLSELPSKGTKKESVGDLRRAANVFGRHPELFLTSAVFQGLHLQFMRELKDRVHERDDLAPESKDVFDQAIYRLATNTDSANFVRMSLWTAIAQDRRMAESKKQEEDIITQADFAAGWHKLEKGGGFSTKLTSKKKAGMPGAKNSSVVVCPYHAIGKKIAAQPLSEEILATDSPPNPNAYGLWCLYSALRRTSLQPEAPHREDLALIADQTSRFAQAEPFNIA